LFLSRATLAEANRVPGAAATGAPRAVALRRVYAVVIGVAGATYYVSLPLLFVVVLLLGGGLVLALLSLGHVPVKLLLIIVVTVLWSCWSILRSLVVLGKDEEPGLRLDLREHGRLDIVLRDVAAQIGTDPIDAVYLTPGTEFGVTERGGLLARIKGTTERALVLGVGALDGFSLRPFKAVLAHEYGHFVNRDTAGGRFSLTVRRSMFLMAQSLAQSGSSRFSPAWLFLVAFSRLFERISQGASRLQEVMADRWSVAAYGTQAFCDGLRHVIERSARFAFEARATLSELQARQAGVTNLYAYRPSIGAPEEEIRRAIDEALNRQPSAYDSHPSPQQRFEWAKLAAGPGAAPADEAEDAWSLFADKASIQMAMTARIFSPA
jgi:Zn-dependent protease with chaperone function